MILVAVLPAILLLFPTHPVHGGQPVEPLKQLDDLVTTTIRETLKKEANSSKDRVLEVFKKLQEAAHWPFAQLDEKIRAYNSYKSYKDTSDSDSGSGVGFGESVIDSIETSNASLRQYRKSFRRRVIRILRRLGIYDPFGKRVWKAIFSDEKNLKKLKEKLDAMNDSSDDDDDDSLWDFIFGFWR